MSELTIDKDRVKKAAENCPQAKETLKTLFPEVFEGPYIEIEPFKVTDNPARMICIGRGMLIGTKYRPFMDRCFILSNQYKWELVRDKGVNILIPTEK